MKRLALVLCLLVSAVAMGAVRQVPETSRPIIYATFWTRGAAPLTSMEGLCMPRSGNATGTADDVLACTTQNQAGTYNWQLPGGSWKITRFCAQAYNPADWDSADTFDVSVLTSNWSTGSYAASAVAGTTITLTDAFTAGVFVCVDMDFDIPAGEQAVQVLVDNITDFIGGSDAWWGMAEITLERTAAP